MGALTDDATIDLAVVPDDELTGYDEVGAYAFLAGIGTETSTANLPLVAAVNDGHTGAMIALVPSDTDARRIAVEDGEPIDQLHVTLAYLGEAASIPADAQARIIRALRAAVEDAVRPDYDLPLAADGFAISVFNPGDTNDRETCLVLGLSGADLDAVHGIVEQTLDQVRSDVGGFTIPDQHAPWVPHLTLIYTDDLTMVKKLTDRVGPITFDKLRVAFADRVTDVALQPVATQLSASVSVAAGGDDMPWTVQRRGGRYCVVKKTDGSAVACHGSEAEAQAQLRALYASEPDARELALAVEYREYLDALDELADAGLLELTRESDVNVPVGGGHNLRDYWVHGEGAVKIRWNTEGDGTRCIRHLRKYVRDPGGLCQEYHRLATGKSMHPHPGRLTESEEDMEEFHGTHDQRSHGNWSHPGKFLEHEAKRAAEGAARGAKSIAHGGHGHGKSGGYGDDVSPEVKHYVQRLRGYVTKHAGESDVAAKLRRQLDTADDSEIDDVVAHLKIRVKGGRDDAVKQIISHLTSKKGTYGGEMLEFAADNPDEPYGDVKYADPGYQADGRKRYPIDTPEHIRAAWSYINMPKNSAKYSADQLKSIRNKIKKALTGTGAEVAAQVQVVTAARGTGQPAPKTDGDCGPNQHRMPDGSCMDDENMPSEAPQQYADEPWEGVLTVEGVESGDGRMFSLGSLDWAELPLPLMYQPANVGGHTGSIMIGEITRAARRGNEIYGWGHVDGSALAGEHGDGIRTTMKTGGVSVDVDKVKDAEVEMVYADGDDGGFMSKPETTIFHRGRVRGATLVAYPAFVEAKLRFTNQVETASTFDDEDCGCADDADEPLTAAGTHTITIPDLPPKAWFDKPTDVKMHGALTITDEGRVYGRLAPAGVTHRNRPRRVPMGNVDYTRWMKGETIVEEGERVVTGVITGNCGHAAEENYGTLADRKKHYDNSCSVFANVRIGEDADGVWVAGALRHGVTSEQVATALGCTLSGDWQPHPDRSGVNEFIAALLVPVPGFPMARTQPSVSYSDGMVTASVVPVRLGEPEPPSVEERARQALRTAKAALLTRAGLDPYSRKREIMSKIGG